MYGWGRHIFPNSPKENKKSLNFACLFKKIDGQYAFTGKRTKTKRNSFPEQRLLIESTWVVDPANMKAFKHHFLLRSFGFGGRRIAKLVDMRAAVLFVGVLLLLSGKGTVSFS